jgi:hypothetical protein
LAERHEIGVVRLVDPPPLHDIFRVKVAEVGDRSAEGGQAESSRRPEHLEERASSAAGSIRGAGPSLRACRVGVVAHSMPRSPSLSIT